MSNAFHHAKRELPFEHKKRGIYECDERRFRPGRVDRIVRHYTERGVPFTWVVHPTAPDGLGGELIRRGMHEVDIVDGMIADLANPPDIPSKPVGFDVREIIGEADARQALDLIASRSKIEQDAILHLYAINEHFRVGTPRALVRLSAAYDDGAMVSRTVLHYTPGIAGVYGVATLPEARVNYSAVVTVVLG